MPYSISEIKKMNIEQLKEVASSLRSDIINTVKNNGGHLASNLGVVELTIALHYVFNSPKDVMLFDVSHQTYVHKLLTGRQDRFHTLRMYNGISGFSSSDESEHDVFEAGHSSTSISLGLGYLEAKTNNPQLFDNIISIIGDASIVNGLSMEALNYLGSKPDQKMIIILNDNEMGISKSTGGLAKTFNKIRVKGRFKFLRKITPTKLKKMMKMMAYKNTPFSGFGLKYLGVIDGHDIKQLIEYLEYAKKSPNSVVLHIKTKKGKGYSFAEEDKTGIWHSTNSFNVETGIQVNTKSDNLNFGLRLAKILSEKVSCGYENIRVITPGMTYGSGLLDFSVNHPSKFIDVGIAEENATVMASAMAKGGLIPFVFMYSTFLQRSYDQIIHDAARKNEHVVFCVDRAGIVDGDGATHQGIYDVAYLSTIPNVKIIAPSSVSELELIISYVINNPGTYVIRYPKFSINEEKYINWDINRWNIVKESSNKKYIITYGPSVGLFNEKINDKSIGLINASFIKPFDSLLINKLLQENNKLYFYEEVIKNNSLSSQVIEYANELLVNKKIDKFYIHSKSLPNTYLEVGSKEELLNKYDMNIDDFIKKVEED